MIKIITTALVASTIIAACAINARAAIAEGDTTVTAPRIEYRDVLKSCGVKWRGSDERKAEKSATAWQAFRAMCVKESGFKPKKGG